MAIEALVSICDEDNAVTYSFPEPSSYNAISTTLVDSGRNTAGMVIASVIRDNVRKIEMQWKFLSATDMSNILKKFAVSEGGSFTNNIKFYDPTVADWVVCEMYVADRNTGAWRRDPTTGDMLGWVDFKLSLVEV